MVRLGNMIQEFGFNFKVKQEEIYLKIYGGMGKDQQLLKLYME